MVQNDLVQQLRNGSAPKNLRMLVARGSAPLPPGDALELLVHLLNDTDSEVASCALKTLASWSKEEVIEFLQSAACSPAAFEYFASAAPDEPVLQAIIANPSAPGKTIGTLALTAPAHLLEKILDNRVRILNCPAIIENVRNNPHANPEILRLILELEIEFFGSKKKEYAVGQADLQAPSTDKAPDLDAGLLPLEDFSLEGLPVDPEARKTEMDRRISCLSVRQKIRQAMFGTREARTFLVRDTNKEVAKSVLRSPKLTESEVESIAAMRSVSEDILRDIGQSKEWTRSYAVVQSLIRNPKTPPAISQRLMFRLRSQDLMQLTRDRSIPDAVRYNATRTLLQRTRSSQ